MALGRVDTPKKHCISRPSIGLFLAMRDTLSRAICFARCSAIAARRFSAAIVVWRRGIRADFLVWSKERGWKVFQADEVVQVCKCRDM